MGDGGHCLPANCRLYSSSSAASSRSRSATASTARQPASEWRTLLPTDKDGRPKVIKDVIHGRVFLEHPVLGGQLMRVSTEEAQRLAREGAHIQFAIILWTDPFVVLWTRPSALDHAHAHAPMPAPPAHEPH